MPRTPGRAKRSASAGSAFLEDVLAARVRDYRNLRRLSQDDLAERMRSLQHGWVRATVSEVERASRSVTVGELYALALALNTPVSRLLDPQGPDPLADVSDVDVGTGQTLPGPDFASTVCGLPHVDGSGKRAQPEWSGNQLEGLSSATLHAEQ